MNERSRLLVWLGWGLSACAETPQVVPSTPVDQVLSGARLLGTGDPALEGQVGVIGVIDGRVEVVALEAELTGEPIDLAGRWLVPGWIDSHVHLRYWDVAAELLSSGVVAAVDLAAPPDFWFTDWAGLDVIGSGPMLTAPAGYPTQSWGRNGYGRECETSECAVAVIDDAFARGARLIKVPLDAGPDLFDDVLRAIVQRAHELDLPVVAHALTDEAARHAADLDFDALAHTPIESLRDETISAWSGKVVISTITAFGATTTTIDNLRRLAGAGAVVLYGTDLGNTRVPAIDPRELELMGRAGLDGDDLLQSLAHAADFWGFDDHGRISPGKTAAFLVYDRDPRVVGFAAPIEVLDLR